MTSRRIMVVAGETSGDTLAAQVVRELRAELPGGRTYSDSLQPLAADLAPRFFGAGGAKMAEAGVELALELTSHAVVGLGEVVRQYGKFKGFFRQLFALALERQPDVILFVDFAGFNRRLAHAIRAHLRRRAGTFNNWNPKLVQLVSPQVWASREGRAYQMARDLDLLLTIFPFEKSWYAARFPRFKVEYIGHPMIDRHQGLARETAGENETAGTGAPRVALLPGSRRSELTRHLPVMLPAFGRMRKALPEARATIVLPDERLAALARGLVSAAQANEAVTIQVGGLAQTLRRADVALASTGTVTMECAYFGVPTVTLYKTSWLNFEIGKLLIKVNSLTMPNLLAGEALLPEFIQDDATPANLAGAALSLLQNEPRRAEIKKRLAEIVGSLGGGGASRRAALEILKLIQAPG